MKMDINIINSEDLDNNKEILISELKNSKSVGFIDILYTMFIFGIMYFIIYTIIK